jgi:hypothetical protein
VCRSSVPIFGIDTDLRTDPVHESPSSPAIACEGQNIHSGTLRIPLEKWGTFATVVGGAAAGLTGLLFVAVSIQIGVIAKSAELRNRAAQTLGLFLTVLFIAILLSIPDQSERLLGAELVVLALLTGAGHLVLDARAKVDTDPGDARAHAVAAILDAVAPNAVTSALLVVAGLLLVFGVDEGLDVLVAPVFAGLGGGVVSAWLLLTKIPE